METSRKLIMLPGPTNVSERVMNAMSRPIINHRGEAFRRLFRSVAEKSKHLFQTQGNIVILSSSGTGGVEAAVWNIVRPGDVVVVPVFGEFSERLAETVALAGGKAVPVRSEFGSAPSFEEVAQAMSKQKKFKAVYLVHNETSTGVAMPYVEQAAKIARESGAFVVVDAISSLGGYSIPVDKWGVDICVTASQKCIAAPPGLALVSVSDRVKEYLSQSPPKTRYFDLSRYIEYGSRGETPYTPALPIFYALDEALTELVEEGLANRVKRHVRAAESLYGGIRGLGLEPFAKEEVRSRTVVATRYPTGVEDTVFRKTMSEKYGVLIAGGFGSLKSQLFRVGCMGLISDASVKTTLAAIEGTLKTIVA